MPQNPRVECGVRRTLEETEAEGADGEAEGDLVETGAEGAAEEGGEDEDSKHHVYL